MTKQPAFEMIERYTLAMVDEQERRWVESYFDDPQHDARVLVDLAGLAADVLRLTWELDVEGGNPSDGWFPALWSELEWALA
jgi:hypothetical protein